VGPSRRRPSLGLHLRQCTVDQRHGNLVNRSLSARPNKKSSCFPSRPKGNTVRRRTLETAAFEFDKLIRILRSSGHVMAAALTYTCPWKIPKLGPSRGGTTSRRWAPRPRRASPCTRASLLTATAPARTCTCVQDKKFGDLAAVCWFILRWCSS